MAAKAQYRFTAGPWNIHEGADPFGPEVRKSISMKDKFQMLAKLGFAGVQFHDDDVVPELDGKSAGQIRKISGEIRTLLADSGLAAEFVAPRLWFAQETIDGGYTANRKKDRDYALQRSKKCIDIANHIGTKNIVLWLAREGTYIREAKDAKKSVEQILAAINMMLGYDKQVRILIEPKPNEPADHTYIPTIGHAIALAYKSDDPARVGGLIETAHAILAGLDPSDEMAYALAHDKLWSVHLNDQNGLKYDEDKSFGSANLRSAFNQVRVLEENGYGKRGEFVGLDVKVMRTQKQAGSYEHLKNSKETFLLLVDKVRSLDRKLMTQYREARDYEGMDAYILKHLMGIS